MKDDLFEQLEVAGLLDGSGRPARLDKLSPAILYDKLRYYRECRIRELNSRESNEISGIRAFRSSISSRRRTLTCLPSAIVYDTVLVDDPVARLYHPERPEHPTIPTIPTNNKSADPSKVANAVGEILKLKPLINSGAVGLVPARSLHDAPDQVPSFFSLRDVLPNILTRDYGQDIASLALQHKTFEEDELLKCYANLPFKKLFNATKELHSMFVPMLRMLSA